MWSETFDPTVDGHMPCTVSFHNHITVLYHSEVYLDWMWSAGSQLNRPAVGL